MIKNKRGGLALGFIFAFFFFLMAMWLLPFIIDSATDARSGLDCTNSSISDGQKLTCLETSVGVPWFIFAILIFIGGLIGNQL